MIRCLRARGSATGVAESSARVYGCCGSRTLHCACRSPRRVRDRPPSRGRRWLHDREVVRDEHVRELELCCKSARRFSTCESRRRAPTPLVEHHDLGPEHERARDYWLRRPRTWGIARNARGANPRGPSCRARRPAARPACRCSRERLFEHRADRPARLSDPTDSGRRLHFAAQALARCGVGRRHVDAVDPEPSSVGSRSS